MTIPRDVNLRSYIEFILISSLTLWWAISTGVLELAAFGFLPEQFEMKKWLLLLILLIVSLSVMVAILVIYKAWPLYKSQYEELRIYQIVRIDNEQVFLLEGSSNVEIGSTLEIFRKEEDVEIPIGFIYISHLRTDGVIQAKPVWIRPVHLRDIELGKVSVRNLEVYRTMNYETICRWVNEESENRIQALFRRGA